MKTLLLAGEVPVFLFGLQQIVHTAHPSYRLLRSPLQRQRLAVLLRDQHIDYLLIDLGQEAQIPDWLGGVLDTGYAIKCLAFGKWEDPSLIKHLIKLGINAYLPHTSSEELILDALQQLEQDSLFLPPELRKRLADYSLGIGKLTTCSRRITPREKQVLRLIIDEYTTREIAELLFISACTAETHRLNLISKFGVKNTAGLVREAVRNHMVSV